MRSIRSWGWAAACAGVIGAGALALGATDADVIHACVGSAGFMRIIEANATCYPSEAPLSWSRQGPPGPDGEQGEQGAPGAQGIAAPGAPAARASVVGRATFAFETGPRVSQVRSFDIELAKPPLHPTIRVSKAIDASTGRLAAAFLSGMHVREVDLALQPPGQRSPVMTYRLTDVRVTAVSQADSGAQGELAIESVALVPGQLELVTGR